VSKLRIVGGRFRGRRIEAPADRTTRPTTDRVREALFNILDHMDPPVLPGAVVLDLFAGTGALGFEALSRGAAQALFIDSDARAVALIRRNAELLGVEASATVLKADVMRLGVAKQAADLAFVDAPYQQDLVAPALERGGAQGWFLPGALVVIESDADETIELPAGFTATDDRTYGGTRLTFCRYGSAPTE